MKDPGAPHASYGDPRPPNAPVGAGQGAMEAPGPFHPVAQAPATKPTRRWSGWAIST